MPTTLKELPNTAVHCKTRDEYDRLMRHCEDAGYVWVCGGERPTGWDGWAHCNPAEGEYIVFERRLSRMSKDYARNESGKRVLSFTDFLREQGLDPPLKVGDRGMFALDCEIDSVRYRKGASWEVVRTNESGVVLIRVSRARRFDEDDEEEDGTWVVTMSSLLANSTLEGPLKPEDLKMGDWVEVVQAFNDSGLAFKKGDRHKVNTVSEHYNWLYLDKSGGDRGCGVHLLWEWNVANLRKCPPPDEGKKEDSATGGIETGPVEAVWESFRNATLTINDGPPLPLKNVVMEFSPYPHQAAWYRKHWMATRNAPYVWRVVEKDGSVVIEEAEPTAPKHPFWKRMASGDQHSPFTARADDSLPPSQKSRMPACPFKVGQELVLTETVDLDGDGNVKGDVCIIDKINESGTTLYVYWKTGQNKDRKYGGDRTGTWYISFRNWKYLSPSSSSPTLLMSVYQFLKNKALSSEERTFRRAGFKNDCGDITDTGREALEAILFEKFSAELVKVAKEMIEEAEKEAKGKKCC